MSLHDRSGPRYTQERLDPRSARHPYPLERAASDYSRSPNRSDQRRDASYDARYSPRDSARSSSYSPRRSRWPPSPFAEDEKVSVSREYKPQPIEDPGDEAQARGTLDQQPLILNADGSESDLAAEGGGQVGEEKGSATPSSTGNSEKRFVLLPPRPGDKGRPIDAACTREEALKAAHLDRLAGQGSREAALKPRDRSPYAFSSGSLKETVQSPGAYSPRQPTAPSTSRLTPGDMPGGRSRPVDMRRNVSSSNLPSVNQSPLQRAMPQRKQSSSHEDLRTYEAYERRRPPQPPEPNARVRIPTVLRAGRRARPSEESGSTDESASDSDFSPEDLTLPPLPRRHAQTAGQYSPQLPPRHGSSSRLETFGQTAYPTTTPPKSMLSATQRSDGFHRSGSNSSQASNWDARAAAAAAATATMNGGGRSRASSKASSHASPVLTPAADPSNRVSWGSTGSNSRTGSRPITPTSPYLTAGWGPAGSGSPRLPGYVEAPGSQPGARPTTPSIPTQPLDHPAALKEHRHHHHHAPPGERPMHAHGSSNTESAYTSGEKRQQGARLPADHALYARSQSRTMASHSSTTATHHARVPTQSKVQASPASAADDTRTYAIPTASTFPIERPVTSSRPTEALARAASAPSKHKPSSEKAPSMPSLPPCPRSKPTAGLKDWFTLQGHTFVNVCPSCRKGLEDAGFDGQFLASPPKGRNELVRCDLSVPWVRMAWLLVLQNRVRNTDIVNQMTRALAHEPPCPGKVGAVRTWYGVVDPESGRFVPNFEVCQACLACVHILFPNLWGSFRRKWPADANVPERNCDFRTDSRRFSRYVDLLEHIAVQAEYSRREPSIGRFVDLASQVTSVRECQEDDQLVDQPWHFMPQLPEFTVCEECYAEVVLPAARADSQLAAQFHRSPRPVPSPPHHPHHQHHPATPVSCQLYSPRMRELFRRAAFSEDFAALKSAALQRVGKERELQMRHAQILAWPEELRREEGARLIEEWRKWV